MAGAELAEAGLLAARQHGGAAVAATSRLGMKLYCWRGGEIRAKPCDRNPNLLPAGHSPARSPRRSQAPCPRVLTHPNPRLRKSLGAPDQARHASSAAPAARRSLLQTTYRAKVKTTAGHDPTKFPHHTRHRGSHGSSHGNTYPLARSKNRKLPR
jgi:hypothetical protein